MSGFITSDGADYLMGLLSGVENVVEQYYVALVTAPVGTAEAGDELTEPDSAEYARAAIMSGPESWMVAYGTMTNLVAVSFPVPGAAAWTGIIGWALCDSPTMGRVFYAGDTDPYDVAIGDQVVMPIGTISIAIELDSWRETT